jgi:ubiquitin carboxyl-terminal hydrolase 4/11/15
MELSDSSVSKVKDPSRSVVTQSAYLLFYRRRSDVPLGGPKFKQIIQDFDNPPESGEDEISESGEEQGPVGSSFRGSSGPLTGVGAAHQRPNLGSASTEMTIVNPSSLENLPAYEAHEQNDDDAPPMLVGDTMMNDGLHTSIEDEGIDMETEMNYSNIGYNNLNAQGAASFLPHNGWNFDNLPGNSRGNHIVSGTGSNEAASDIVQNNSSASEGSREGRMEDFSNAAAEDDYIEQSPVPDLDEEAQNNIVDIRSHLLEAHATNAPFVPPNFEFKATDADDDFEEHYDDEPATEIHVEEGEGLDPAAGKSS